LLRWARADNKPRGAYVPTFPVHPGIILKNSSKKSIIVLDIEYSIQ
jgi:hypothetical protein